MSDVSKAALLCVITILSVIQIPLDVRFHELSRRATLLATLAVVAIGGIDALQGESWSSFVAATYLSLLLLCCYGLLHWLSPKSLGFGDVLLVVPLTFAVAYAAVDRVFVWQLLAASSGALHALITRLRTGSTTVPFGPHLLGAAWLVLVFSL
jgi:prepilin signal peptidase PulO-like enzyme (type II secretory pathway)